MLLVLWINLVRRALGHFMCPTCCIAKCEVNLNITSYWKRDEKKMVLFWRETIGMGKLETEKPWPSHRSPRDFNCCTCSCGRGGGIQSGPKISPSRSSTTYSCIPKQKLSLATKLRYKKKAFTHAWCSIMFHYNSKLIFSRKPSSGWLSILKTLSGLKNSENKHLCNCTQVPRQTYFC